MAFTASALETLRPTAALLSAQTAVAASINALAVAPTPHDDITHDLLLRIAHSPQQRLRGVDLCRQLQLSPSYVSRRIDRAEADGLVARGPDPDDRRAQSITLTAAGRAAVDDFVPRLTGVVDRIVTDTLTRAERAQLIELLGRIEAAGRGLLEDDTDHRGPSH